jgi:hypothetical protein
VEGRLLELYGEGGTRWWVASIRVQGFDDCRKALSYILLGDMTAKVPAGSM